MTWDPSHTAWVSLAVSVAVYDAWAVNYGCPTMSQAFKEAAQSKGGLVVLLSWAYLTGHLFGHLPEHSDLLKRVFQ
jgi:hypothetical protein